MVFAGRPNSQTDEAKEVRRLVTASLVGQSCLRNVRLGSSSAFEQGAGHSRFCLSKPPVAEHEANENVMLSRASVRRLAALGQQENSLLASDAPNSPAAFE